MSSSPFKSANSLSAIYFSLISDGVPASPLVNPGETTGSASSHILPTGSLKAPSPYTITSKFLSVMAFSFAWISSTNSCEFLGNNFKVSSVALFEPRSPYSLYPLPSTGAFNISSSEHTFCAPESSKSFFVLFLVCMSQFITFFVYFKIAFGSLAKIISHSAPASFTIFL